MPGRTAVGIAGSAPDDIDLASSAPATANCAISLESCCQFGRTVRRVFDQSPRIPFWLREGCARRAARLTFATSIRSVPARAALTLFKNVRPPFDPASPGMTSPGWRALGRNPPSSRACSTPRTRAARRTTGRRSSSPPRRAATGLGVFDCAGRLPDIADAVRRHRSRCSPTRHP